MDIARWLAPLAAVGLFAVNAAAQTPPAKAPPADPGAAAAQQLNLNRQRLDETNRRAREIKADLDANERERAQVMAKLQETGRFVQEAEGQLTSIEKRIDELHEQKALIQGSLQSRHGEIGRLLAAMQRMGRNPPPVIITRREDALEMVRSAMLLSKAFPHLQGKAEHLVKDLTELTRIIDESKAERDRLAVTTAAHRDGQARLAALMELKRQNRSELQQELAQINRQAQDLARSVSDLTELVAKLDKVISERTQLGTYEREIAAAPPPPASEPKPAAPAAATPPPAAPSATEPTAQPAPPSKVAAATPPPVATPPSPKAAVVLAPAGAAFTANPGRIKPAIPFHLAKGQLPMPAHGRRVLNFGEKSQYGSASKGIVIETRAGAQVTSPCDGWVVYAGEFRTYGQLLIINAGGGYHVLLAGLSQINVQLGQFVLAAEPVGTMRAADRSRPAGTTVKDALPLLFVEFRKDGQPINPDPWWAEASQKVQG